MNFSAVSDSGGPARTVWSVGALCAAVADTLSARFGAVTVSGELAGVSRPASGHLYFTLKDPQGQLRAAMFRRAAQTLDFEPRDGQRVEVRGRLTVYEPRGDLQLVVESMRQAGQGALYEEFLRLKSRLDAMGLFDPARKRPAPAAPACIGVVTSRSAAALQDVLTALRRRAPHVPVIVSPASVQGSSAPAELVAALQRLYALCGRRGQADSPEVILLVRGGGSLEDLWSFNHEALARCIVDSPVPLISGVGHETDVTIADFCADLRAPTPTAAAELAARPLQHWRDDAARAASLLRRAAERRIDVLAQRLDTVQSRLGRPSARAQAHRMALAGWQHRLRNSVTTGLSGRKPPVAQLALSLQTSRDRLLERHAQRLAAAATRLGLLDPSLVLRRGYAWITDESGHTVMDADQLRAGQVLHAVLADGAVDLTVRTR